MKSYPPRIEETSDGVRIEFRTLRNRRAWLDVILFPAFVVCLYWLSMRMSNPQESSSWAWFRFLWYMIFLVPLWLSTTWRNARRYSVVLSQEVLTVRQEAFGLHWTRRYPLE